MHDYRNLDLIFSHLDQPPILIRTTEQHTCYKKLSLVPLSHTWMIVIVGNVFSTRITTN